MQPRDVAAQEGEARARQLGAGLEIHSQRGADIGVFAGFEIEAALLAPLRQFDIVALVRAVGHILRGEVGQGRQQMVELDRSRNANREALAALRRAERAEGAAGAASHKYWTLQGDVFVRRRHGSARELLEAEQKRLDGEIEALRQSVKQKTSRLCELDPSIAGGSNVHRSFTSLTGVSASELQGMLR